MEAIIETYGVLGVVCILLYQEVMRRRGSGGGETKEDLSKLKTVAYNNERMIKDLHEWHSKEDEDGVKIWYVRPSLAKSIDQLAEAIQSQNRIFERLIMKLDNTEIE